MGDPARQIGPPAIRTRLGFEAVNHRHRPGFDPGLQRHHLLPRQLQSLRCFSRMLDALGHQHVGFDDFRHNGMLLPARDEAAVRLGLPLHCGPHRRYNELVIARVGLIEQGWAALESRKPAAAREAALLRLRLLQRALRRRLFEAGSGSFRLNRRDPRKAERSFAELDAMAVQLWPETEV